MAGKKDEDFPETTLRLIQEFWEALEEERRAGDAFAAHLNATYSPAAGDEVDAVSAPRLARGVMDLYERGGAAEEADEETARLARAYLDAIQKGKDVWSIMTAEIAASHPEHLDELNRERSPEELVEMLDELRGEEDPPEAP